MLLSLLFVFAAALASEEKPRNLFPEALSWNPAQNIERVAQDVKTCFENGNVVLTPGCQNVLLRRFGRLFYRSQLSYEQCGMMPIYCNQIRTKIGKTILELQAQGLDLFSGSEILFGRRAQTWNERNRWLWHLSKFYKQSASIEIGESRYVSSDSTGISSGYQLTRTSALHYEIGLNIMFKSKMKDFETTWKPLVRERMVTCYNEASAYIKGPEGETVALKLLPEDSQHPIEVTIDEEVSRVNAANGDLSAKCPVILHETMHLLGLADSYLERARGVSYDKNMQEQVVTENPHFRAYNMRTLSTSQSIMSWQDNAYKRARRYSDWAPSEFMACICVEHDEECIQKLTVWSPERSECPDGIEQELVKQSQLSKNIFSTRGFVFLKKQRKVGRVVEMKNPSLLYPSEINAILYPGDIVKNWQYYYCVADQAYATSLENLGETRGFPEPRKSICKSGESSWLYGVPSELQFLLLRD